MEPPPLPPHDNDVNNPEHHRCLNELIEARWLWARDGRVWPADNGPNAFVVGLSAISGDLFPPQDITTPSD